MAPQGKHEGAKEGVFSSGGHSEQRSGWALEPNPRAGWRRKGKATDCHKSPPRKVVKTLEEREIWGQDTGDYSANWTRQGQ